MTMETKILNASVLGWGYMLGTNESDARDVDAWAKHFGIQKVKAPDANEPVKVAIAARFIAVVRALFESCSYTHIQDPDVFGDTEPHTFREWYRSYRRSHGLIGKDIRMMEVLEPVSNVCNPHQHRNPEQKCN